MSRFISKFPVIALVIGTLSVAMLPAAHADAVADALANYQAQGAVAFDAQAGARRWTENFTDAETANLSTARPATNRICARPASISVPSNRSSRWRERESAAAYRC